MMTIGLHTTLLAMVVVLRVMAMPQIHVCVIRMDRGALAILRTKTLPFEMLRPTAQQWFVWMLPNGKIIAAVF